MAQNVVYFLLVGKGPTARLLSLLWEDPGLKGEGLPLAHAEFPTRTNANEKYDLVLVMPDVAKRIPAYFVQIDALAKVQQEPLVAAVEIKLPYLNPYSQSIRADIDKL